jgi:hypothetical protein
VPEGEGSGLVRRAGSGRLADRSTVVWTVSEGRRGRRWREVVAAPEGGVRSSLLLETDPDRRFSHLELSTAAGLLTLHPEGDGSLHGNAVSRPASAVVHVVGLPFGADDILLVDGSPTSLAAAIHALGGPRTASGAVQARCHVVTAELTLAASDEVVARTADDRWRIGDREIRVDGDGCPVLTRGRSWPLELDP